MQVVKLDIDNVEVEMAFMTQIIEDAHLRSQLSEVMFEMHYSHRWVAARCVFGRTGAGSVLWNRWAGGVFERAGLVGHAVKQRQPSSQRAISPLTCNGGQAISLSLLHLPAPPLQ